MCFVICVKVRDGKAREKEREKGKEKEREKGKRKGRCYVRTPFFRTTIVFELQVRRANYACVQTCCNSSSAAVLYIEWV